jgi:hypothetical protein
MDKSFKVAISNTVIGSEKGKLALRDETFPWKYIEYHPALPNFNNRSGSATA